MPHFAIILSGCGYLDGSDVYEVVSTLIALERAGATWQALAPDCDLDHVSNHLTNTIMPGASRNALLEAARITGGKTVNVAQADPLRFDGAIVPGGFGPADTLSDLGAMGTQCTVRQDISDFIATVHGQGKPIGSLGIGSAVVARILAKPITVTIGDDPDLIAMMAALGVHHEVAAVDGVVVDRVNRIASSPCAVNGASLSQIIGGTAKVVGAVIQLGIPS